MANIFDTPDWLAATTFQKDGFCKYLGFYYYSLVDNNTNNIPSVNSIYWGGVGLDPVTNEQRPEFIWKPAYGMDTNIDPRVNRIQFGDGYTQRIPDGINIDLIKTDISFENRTDSESTAIIHFLKARQGSQPFLYTLPPPFNKKKKFVVNNIRHNKVFYNNNAIKANIEEVV